MQIDYLKEFVEVAYCLSYSKAAKNLGTSQSSISKHIQSLEKHYEALLFERDTSNVSLTPFGIALVQETMTLLDAHSRFDSAMKELRNVYKKSLVIGGMHYNPKVMRLLREAQRDGESGKMAVPVQCRSSLTDPLFTSLDAGIIDVAIALREDVLANDEHIHFTDLFSDPLFALMKSSHPLANRSSVSLSELSEWTFLKPSGSYFVLGNETLETIFAEEGIAPKARAVFVKNVQGFLAIDFMDDVTLIEGGIASTIPADSGLVCIPIADETASFPIMAACKASNEHAAAFVDALHVCGLSI